MFRSVLHDKTGATLAYVALLLLALLGVVGLSYDLGRHYILSVELQKAADAAAIAGAYQLSPTGDPAQILADATTAATGAVVQNRRRLGNSPGDVSIATVQGLQTIPASDDTPIGGASGPPYNYIRAITEATVANNVFARAAGQADTITLQREAVATKGRAVCQITPLAICNPNELTEGPGADFNAEEYFGRQILVRAHGGGNQAWAPGNFGFLDVDGFGNGARGLADALGVNGAGVCFNTEVQTEPGQTNGARAAINTRFDMYENPFFRNADDDPDFPPAENVIKGYNTDANNFCRRPRPSNDPDFMGLPRDTDLSDANRFGNGQWNCFDYWDTVHPGGVPRPPGCGNTPGATTSAITRFEVYRYEIDNNLVPDGSVAENGQPQCADPNANPPASPTNGQLHTDRRIIAMAVLNCLEFEVRGNTTLPAEAFINGFITEPVLDAPGNADSGDIVLEVVGSNQAGAGGLVPVVERSWVEVVR